jgi:hypothetical protein
MERRSTGPISDPRLWRWLLALSAVANIAPLYFAGHLPFCDLPEHLAAIATIRHYWDASWGFQRYFVLQGLTHTSYVLYDVVGALLAIPFGSVERANLFLLSLIGLGFPFGLRELLRATHRDERLAVLACPLFWNRALGEGLVNYVASIPVALFGLALAARQSETPTRARAWLLAAVAVVLFYLHASGLVLFVGGAIVFMLFTRLDPPPATRRAGVVRRLARLPRQLVWLAPAIGAALVLLIDSPFVHPEPAREGVHAGVVRFSSNATLLRSLPAWMYDFWRSPADDWACALAWLLFALVLFSSQRQGDDARPVERAAPWVAFFAILLYFTMPNQVGFAFILDLRLAPCVGLLLPLLVRAPRERVMRIAALGMTAVALFVGAHCAWQMREFERDEASSFDRVVRNLPRGKKLVTLIFDRESSRANVGPFLHFGSYYAARFGGVASFSFAEVPHWPIQYRPELAPPKKPTVFWDWNPCLFQNTIDGTYYDFVLTRGELRPFADAPPGPVWRMIGGAREWTLYEKTGESRAAKEGEIDRGPCTLRGKNGASPSY